MIERIEALGRRVGVPSRLADLGIRHDQIPALVKSSRGQSMSGNPRDVSDAQLTPGLLEKMLVPTNLPKHSSPDSMNLSAGLTPAWQQILVFDRLSPGEVNRAREAVWCGSGKVLNVGLAVHHLGGPSLTLAPLGGPPLLEIEREFAAMGVPRRAGFETADRNEGLHDNPRQRYWPDHRTRRKRPAAE